ncbi:MAG: carbon storage regulator CsrA [Rickettsiales endosymbiont of Dermacentor nuttalli]
MLYITRKIDEAIIINNEIEIKIIEVKGKTVKLGCSFPSETAVLRKEIYDKIMQANIEASCAILDKDIE